MEYRCNSFARKANNELRWVIEHIIKFLQFQKTRVENRDITAATLRNYVKSLKSFCEICEITIPWKKITRGLPRGRQSSTDRAPKIDEIRKLLDYPDRRIKPIIFTMISSGIRLGAWDWL
jgi:integrase